MNNKSLFINNKHEVHVGLSSDWKMRKGKEIEKGIEELTKIGAFES